MSAEETPKIKGMTDEQVKEQFEKLELVLRETAEKFRQHGISPQVYAASMLEVGVLALIHLGANDERIHEVVTTLIDRNRALKKDAEEAAAAGAAES